MYHNFTSFSLPYGPFSGSVQTHVVSLIGILQIWTYSIYYCVSFARTFAIARLKLKCHSKKNVEYISKYFIYNSIIMALALQT